MTQSSLSPELNDTPQQQDVIEIKTATRSVGRKATILKKNFSGRFKPHWSAKSIASLSLREVAREAGIAPNSFYRHFKDIDELAISLIDRAGIVYVKLSVRLAYVLLYKKVLFVVLSIFSFNNSMPMKVI